MYFFLISKKDGLYGGAQPLQTNDTHTNTRLSHTLWGILFYFATFFEGVFEGFRLPIQFLLNFTSRIFKIFVALAFLILHTPSVRRFQRRRRFLFVFAIFICYLDIFVFAFSFNVIYYWGGFEYFQLEITFISYLLIFLLLNSWIKFFLRVSSYLLFFCFSSFAESEVDRKWTYRRLF